MKLNELKKKKKKTTELVRKKNVFYIDRQKSVALQDSESALTLYPFLPLSFLLVLFLQFTY